MTENDKVNAYVTLNIKENNNNNANLNVLIAFKLFSYFEDIVVFDTRSNQH